MVSPLNPMSFYLFAANQSISLDGISCSEIIKLKISQTQSRPDFRNRILVIIKNPYMIVFARAET